MRPELTANSRTGRSFASDIFMRVLVALAALAALFAVTSCGGSGGGGGGESVKVTVSPTTATTTPGGSIPFTATVTGSDNSAVTWSASGGTIGTDGVYTAPTTTGSYTVTATSVADTSKTASATVTVSNATGVTVSVSPVTVSVAPGGEVQFTATVNGTDNKQVEWSVSPLGAGSITSDGLFTAGSSTQVVTVTAKSVASPTTSAFSRVTITNTAPRITLSPLGANVPTNGTVQFTATVSNTTNTAVTWTATGGTISTSGLYQAGSAAGTYKVTATSQADTSVSASATVTVTAIGITVTPNGATASVGQEVQFAARVTGTTNASVTWSTDKGSISSSGLLTAPSTAGTVTVTATSVADPSASATATLTVVAASEFNYTFESGVPAAWTPSRSSSTPTGGRNFYGRFSGTETGTLTLSSLSPHTSLTVSFDLFVIGGWTGESANSKFSVMVGSATPFAQTFSNVEDMKQTYPDSGSFDPGTGATEKDTLGYPHDPDILYEDSVYHISFTIDHTADSTTLKFFANLVGELADKSWGIDNVKIRANP